MLEIAPEIREMSYNDQAFDTAAAAASIA